MTTTLQPLGSGTSTFSAQTAKLLDGSVVIVWREYTGGFLDDDELKFQIFDAQGGPKTSELEVGTFLLGTSYDPGTDIGVTALSDGGFAISYDFVESGETGPSFTTIRTFDSRGVSTDHDYVAALNSFGTLAAPDGMNRLTGLVDGGWIYTFTDGTGGTAEDVYFYRFDALGNPVSTVPTLAHQSTAGVHDLGTSIGLASGGFLVLYRVANANGQEIRAQGFDILGNFTGPEFVIASKSAASGLEIGSIRTASLEDGNHAIIWTEVDGLDAKVEGRIINDAGAAVSAVFQVSDTAGGIAPSVSALPDSGFLVGWVNGDLSTGGAGDHVRRFDSDGTAEGASKLIDGRFLNDGVDASIQALDRGGFIALIDSGLTNNQILFQIHDQASNLDDVLFMSAEDASDWFSALGGDDLVYGTSGNDTIFGSWGEDTVYALGGNDIVRLGDGDVGSSTVQHAYGGWGNDILSDGSDEAYLDGGDGYDILRSGGGNDTLKGGAGRDLLQASWGSDLIYGGTGNDTVYGGDDSDEIYGENGHDILWGGTGNDLIRGGRGEDTIYGNDGDDWLQGDDLNDVLISAAGNDTLTGGSGQDEFTFNKIDFGQDIITDYADGFDKIAFGDAVATAFGDLTITRWEGTTVIDVAGGQILVLNSWGQIETSDFIF